MNGNFSLLDNKDEKNHQSCCLFSTKKKQKQKFLIQDDKGSVSFYNNSQRNTLYSQATFSKEENNITVDDEDY